MGTRLIVTVLFLTMVGLAGPGQAAVEVRVDVTYTADNVVGAFYQNGGDWTYFSPGPNRSNWQNADTAEVALEGGIYSLVFRVNNAGGPGPSNPAGFLAELSGDAGSILSSSAWQYAIDSGGDPPSDFNNLNWASVTVWSHNQPKTGDSSQIWYNVKGGPVEGISNDAAWIWSGNNFADDTDQYLWVRIVFDPVTMTVIPEPASLLIWGLLGLVAVVGTCRLRRKP